MLARAESTLPGGDYAYEVKWDGFRAIVSTDDGFRVRSRRGWNMAPLIPELAREDVRGVFDGELVAFKDRMPHFPLVIGLNLARHGDLPEVEHRQWVLRATVADRRTTKGGPETALRVIGPSVGYGVLSP
jgi:hypothetical protein